MRKFLLTSASLLLLPTLAFAGGENDHGQGAQANSISRAVSTSNPVATARVGDVAGGNATATGGNPTANVTINNSTGRSGAGRRPDGGANGRDGNRNGGGGTNGGGRGAADKGNGGGTGSNGNGGGNGGGWNGGGGGQTSGVGGTYTVRNTPDVSAPWIAGGNPCSVGVSGGLALPGFGIVGGGSWGDKECERRQSAALLHNMGERNAAIEVMCGNGEVQAAMARVGQPCVKDRPTVATQVAAPMVVPAVARSGPRPAWCNRVTKNPTEAQAAYIHQNCT